MPRIDDEQREIILKLVYFGIALGGKTTCMQYVYERTDPARKTKIETIATEELRAYSFTFVPATLGLIDGRSVRFWLITHPGPIFNDPSRRKVLENADGIIFVADSQIERSEGVVGCMEEMLGHLEAHGKSVRDVPLVIAYNKRDLPNAAPIETLERALNPWGVPHFELVARTGQGVFDSLKACARAMMDQARAWSAAQR
jgi:signal recognition particle receptor subunit beta